MALIDDFKTRFPEFNVTVVNSRVPVLEGIYPSYYGDSYTAANKEIILNLIAHLLVLDSPTSVSTTNSSVKKFVTSKSTTSNGLSTDYAKPESLTFQQEFFSSTSYGQRFLYLSSFNIGARYA
ncbi:MAG: DUF4054 domain-containing protein [Deferribacterales bacterium]